MFDSEINTNNINYKSISCENISELFLDKLVAKKHFGKFGKINRFILRPKRLSCTVEYQSEEDAKNALLNAGIYNGQEFNIKYSTNEVAHTRNTEEWVDPEVQSELDAMSGYGISMQTWPTIAKPLPPKQPKSILKSKPTIESVAKIDVTYKAELQTTLRNQALTSEDKFHILDARDKLIRLRKVQNTDIEKAVSTKGFCPDMCPEKERLMRESKQQISCFEMDPNNRKIINHQIAIKEYSRSSADQETPLAHELRPEPVLKMTMNYLMQNIMDLIESTDVNVGDWYHFVWDRTRSIRKDITQQELCSLVSVELVEQCARFHIHCSARLLGEDVSIFDEKINTENLTKCLQTLKYMYHDLRLKNIECPNEKEFRAYIILLNLNDSNFLWEIKNLPKVIQDSQEVRFAIFVYLAMANNNYIKFFRFVRETTYLNACILLRYFTQVRLHAVKTMIKAYSSPRSYAALSLIYLTDMLAFNTEESAALFFEYYGLACEGDKIHFEKMSFSIPDLPIIMDRSFEIIESKREQTVGEVICGRILDSCDDFENHVVHDSFDENGFLRPESWDAEDQMDREARSKRPPKHNIDKNLFKVPISSPPISPKQQLKSNLFGNKVIQDKNRFSLFKPIENKSISASQSLFTNSTTSASPTSVLKSFSFIKNLQEPPPSTSTVTTTQKFTTTNTTPEPINSLFSIPKSSTSSGQNTVFGSLPVFGSKIPFSDKQQETKISSIFGQGINKQTTIQTTGIFSLNTAPSGQIPSTFQEITKANELKTPTLTFGKPNTELLPKPKNIPSEVMNFKKPESSFSFLTNISDKMKSENNGFRLFGNGNSVTSAFSVPQKVNLITPAQRELEEAEEEKRRKKQELLVKLFHEEEEGKRKEELERNENRRKIEEKEIRAKEQEHTRKIEKITKKSHSELDKLFDSCILNELNDIINEELENYRTLLSKCEDLAEELLDETLCELMTEIADGIDRKIRRENLIEAPSVWCVDENITQTASKMACPLQNETLEMMRRYRLGVPERINLRKPEQRPLDVLQLCDREFQRKDVCSDRGIIKSRRYFKLVVSLPNEKEEGEDFYNFINLWLSKMIIRQRSDIYQPQKMFFCESRGNLNICIRKVEGIVPINEDRKLVTNECNHANAVVFVMTTNNIQNSRKRLHYLLKLSRICKHIPIAIIVCNTTHDLKNITGSLELDKLVQENCISCYDIVDSDTRHLAENFRLVFKYLSRNSHPKCSLEMQHLSSFLRTALADELWARFSDTWISNLPFRTMCKHPQNLIFVYNEGIDKLITMASEDYENYEEFPDEFRTLVPPLPLDIPQEFEYFPSDWKNYSRNRKIVSFLKILKLKICTILESKTHFANFEELETSIKMYAGQCIEDEDTATKAAYSAINLLPSEFVEIEQISIESVSWLNIIKTIALHLLSFSWSLASEKLPNEIIYEKKLWKEYTTTAWWLSTAQLKAIRIDPEKLNADAAAKKQPKQPQHPTISKDELTELLAKGNNLVEKAERNIQNIREFSEKSQEVTYNLHRTLYEQEKLAQNFKKTVNTVTKTKPDLLMENSRKFENNQPQLKKVRLSDSTANFNIEEFLEKSFALLDRTGNGILDRNNF